MENENYYTAEYSAAKGASAAASANAMIRKVYWWMFGALTITGLVAFYVATDASALNFVFGTKGVFLGLIIAELALVIGLTAAINRLSAVMATIMFLVYSVINGMMLSSIFIVYQLGSIAATFFITAGTFGIMAVIGSVTKKDLTKVGNICMMALIGLLIALLVNIFLRNTVFELIVSFVGVLIFVGLTAYDAQKIKAMLYGAEESETTSKIAVLGALTLYLDFINIFLYLLRLFGKRN